MDPNTGAPPPDAIQRILFLCPRVHIYQIPPQPTAKGHVSQAWLSPPERHIFTARLRLIEVAIPKDEGGDGASKDDDGGEENLSLSILLEDPSSGDLFAASPVLSPHSVSPALDSSRFFAITVVSGGGNGGGGKQQKAVLGIGFEDRSEALDFLEGIREGGKAMGWGEDDRGKKKEAAGSKVKRDWSLKEGEMLSVDIGGLGKKGKREDEGEEKAGRGSVEMIKTDGGGFALIPPPPSGRDVKAERRRSREIREMGFDDGKFGEFQ